MLPLVRQRGRTGFTMVEILLLVSIMLLLALLVLPRLLAPKRRTMETALLAQLRDLRYAISHFEGDCGDNPASLTDLLTRPEPGSRGGRGVVLDVEAWEGPYLVTRNRALPPDPITKASDWVYDAATGSIHSASAATGTDGTRYDTW